MFEESKLFFQLDLEMMYTKCHVNQTTRQTWTSGDLDIFTNVVMVENHIWDH